MPKCERVTEYLSGIIFKIKVIHQELLLFFFAIFPILPLLLQVRVCASAA
jgi:hypothetical protein